MRLCRFTVEGFAQLRHVVVEFRDDAPNIIVGPNETGKSHLMQAFCAMFFPLEGPDTLLPWYGEPIMRGCLEFVDGQNHRVRLEREYRGATVLVSQDGAVSWTGKVKGSTPEAQRFAACRRAWLGLGDQALFTATTVVRQADVLLQNADGDRRAMASQVKELITGTQETSYEQVLKSLCKQRDDVRKRPGARKNRELEEKLAELAAVRAQYIAADEVQQRWALLDHQLAELAREIEEKALEREAIDQRLHDSGQLLDLEQKAAQLTEQFGKLDADRQRLANCQMGLTAARAECSGLTPFTTVDETLLTTVQRDVDEARREVVRLDQGGPVDLHRLSALEGTVRAAEGALNGLPPWPADIPIELIREAQRRLDAAPEIPDADAVGGRMHWPVVVALAAAGLILAVLAHPIFLILVAASVVYALLSRGHPDSRTTVPRAAAGQRDKDRLHDLVNRVGAATVEEAEQRWVERQAARQRLDRAQEALQAALHALGVVTVEQARGRERDRSEAKVRLATAERTRAEILSRLGVATIGEAQSGFGNLRRAQAEVQRLEGAISALGDAHELENRWQQMGTESATMRFELNHLLDKDAALKALGTPEARAAHLAALRLRADQLTGEVAALESQVMEGRGARADLGNAGQGDVPVLYHRIEELEGDIARLQRKASALDVAIEELERAVAHFRDHCLGGVMEDTSSFLAAMTSGRYSRVEVEPDTLIPSVITADRMIPVTQLSRGVQDQLYFALRVALGRALTHGRTLPLVLDDPFVNFDPVRRDRVLALLRGLVDRTQVILFTCDPRYGEAIQPILELSAEEPAMTGAISVVA